MTQQDSPAVSGPDFYDDVEVFNTYLRSRMRTNGPNETLEKPVIWELLQNASITGARILDLGCGSGLFGQELLDAGCKSYTGVEGSRRMVALAKETITHPAGEVVLANMENWDYPTAYFDLVISRSALHYIEDLAQLLRQVYQTLVPGGRFVFSVEHPVMTSCNRSRGEKGDALRQDLDRG